MRALCTPSPPRRLLQPASRPLPGISIRLLVPRHRGEILNEDYAGDITLTTQFPITEFEAFQFKLRELSAGKLQAEIIETKESRIVLKNAQFERTIKIGGGRDAPVRREASPEEEIPPSEGGEEPRFDRKRDRRRRGRRRTVEEREEMRAEVVAEGSRWPLLFR